MDYFSESVFEDYFLQLHPRQDILLKLYFILNSLFLKTANRKPF